MSPRSFIFSPPSLFALLAGAPQFSLAQKSNPKSQGEKRSAASDVARGKYLVEGVAMCGQCHTPRDSNGASIEADGYLEFPCHGAGQARFELTSERGSRWGYFAGQRCRYGYAPDDRRLDQRQTASSADASVPYRSR